MLLEIGLLKGKTKQTKTKQIQKQIQKQNKTKAKKKKNSKLHLVYPSSYFYNKRCNMLL